MASLTSILGKLFSNNKEVALVENVASNTDKGLATAWVNFDGTAVGTFQPRDGFNIASITRTATGSYTITFTTPMDNANYSVVGLAQNGVSGGAAAQIEINSSSVGVFTDRVEIITRTNTANTPVNHSTVCLQIFGGKN